MIRLNHNKSGRVRTSSLRGRKKSWSSGKIRFFWQSVISMVLFGIFIGIFSWSGHYAHKAQAVIRQYVVADYGMTPVFNFLDSVMAWGNSLEQPVEPELPAAADLSMPADGQARPVADSLQGMWIETAAGAELRAVMSGVIVKKGQSAEDGLWCLLDSNTGWSFRYSHCGSLAVDVGDQVEQGEILGYAEKTGENEGRIFVQVFYEDQLIDPVSFFIGQS